jgi:hypothetical protein
VAGDAWYGQLFPWKKALGLLADAGLVWENYPENVLLPGDLPMKGTKSKGINDLTVDEQKRLLNAEHDKHHPMHIKKVSEARREGKFSILCSAIRLVGLTFICRPQELETRRHYWSPPTIFI